MQKGKMYMFNYNPYYQPQMNRYQPMEYQQYQPSYPQNTQTYPQASLGLQGKLVDSIEVVKAMDIPLDNSISYFPLIDNSAIITKQISRDGASKMVIFKPDMSVTNGNDPKTNFDTDGINYIKEELKSIKTQIQALGDNLKGVDVNESTTNIAGTVNE